MSKMTPAVSALAASYAAGRAPGKPTSALTPAEQTFAQSFNDKPRPIQSEARAEARRFIQAFGTLDAADYLKRGLSFAQAAAEHKGAGKHRAPTAAEHSGGALGALAQEYADRS